MKLFWIKLVNYRQYRGEAFIEFSTSDSKNITVVEGTTGAGKTTLLNAIYWCLYGREPEFEKLESGVAPICNRATLAEMKVMTDVSVELAFGEDEPRYIFKRDVAIWNHDKKPPSPEVIRLTEPTNHSHRLTTLYLNSNLMPVVTFDARTKVRSGDEFTPEPDYLVDNVLPPDLAFVFFFNGEALKEFFERRNLQQALEEISQIALVRKGIEHLSTVSTELRRAASKESADTEALSKQLDETDRVLEEKRRKKQVLEEEIVNLNRKMAEIDNELKSLNQEHITNLIDKRNQAVLRAEELEKEIEAFDKERNGLLLDAAPATYLQDQIAIAIEKIGEFDQRGKLPPDIKTVFLRDLIDKGVCICGRPLDSHEQGGPEARKHIQELLEEQSSDEAIATKALNGSYRLPDILSSLQKNLAKLQELGGKATRAEEALIKEEERSKSISNELAQYTSAGKTAEEIEERVRSLQSNRNTLEEARVRALSDAGGEKRDIERLDADATQLGRKITFELGKKAKGEILNVKWTLSANALQLLIQIRDEMISEVRKDMQRGTDAHFRNLIWKTANIEKKSGEQPGIDLKKLLRVEIGEDNEIRVITKNGENWIRSLSQGEKQTLAYSFISALKEGARVVFPMVVDTPLGIIDEGPPRELFAELLPEFVKNTQLIFLMTSAEYTPRVRGILSSKVGRAYRLSFDRDAEGTMVEKIA